MATKETIKKRFQCLLPLTLIYRNGLISPVEDMRALKFLKHLAMLYAQVLKNCIHLIFLYLPRVSPIRSMNTVVANKHMHIEYFNTYVGV